MTRRYPNTNKFGLLVGLAFLLALLLSSCSSDFYCSKCPTITKETTIIHDTTVIRDTIVKIEERTLEIHDTVPCDDFELNKDSGGVKIKVLVKDKIIYVKASCAALELKLQLYDKIRTITHTKELTRFQKKKSNPWPWIILGFVVASVLWNWKRILGLILKVVKPG